MPKGKGKQGGDGQARDAKPVSAEDALRCILIIFARAQIPEDRVREVVGGLTKAYNLCDGTRLLTEVARLAGKDAGNFSRAAQRWVEEGVAFRLSNGALLHAFPIRRAGSRKKGEK
jgi:hypothetical protein